MSNDAHDTSAGPLHRWAELGLAALMGVFALVVIVGSMQAGQGWATDGPKAGFFPFYVGLFILGASLVNLFHAWSEPSSGRLFAEWGQLAQVVSVVIPSALYVALVPWVGIYLASALLIAAFMKWFGGYGWSMVLLVAVGTPVATFMVFEWWFLVPLPKGPIEDLLGL